MENLKIEGYIWLETTNGLKIGRGRAKLLNCIDKTGSIAAAAREIGIPYRKAWGMVKEMNEFSNTALVFKNLGGKNGGGAFLTKEGKKIVEKYKKINGQFILFKSNTL
ncbi:molybdate transport system regulatory protein [Apibacter mensalis]|uniref:Molybdate transport system regulatory protein n=1 Tax=Apibacter mensalis TaxID=1586267 RepID=A0A0X3ARP8_9FLAO|nr:LysR family transcriptional regulator [Apibacter mensalis]CVK17066.1 molybdate transport system regulatory protein [Apibacter mensalis]